MRKTRQALWLRLYFLLVAADFEFAELLCALELIAWGVWVANPWTRVFPTSPTFQVLAQHVDEDLFGLIPLGIGLAQLAVLVTDHRGLRRHVALWAFAVWAFIWTAFVLGNVWGTATVVYPGFMLCAAWAFWRLGRKGSRRASPS